MLECVKEIYSLLEASEVVALAAVFISILALFATIWQSYATRKHNILSVKPLLDIDRNLSPVEGIKVVLRNNGIGVAIIETLKVEYKSITQDFSSEVISTIGAQYSITFPAFHASIVGKGTSLRAGDLISLVEFETYNGDNESVIKLISDLSFIVEYRDIYGNNHKLPK